MFKVYVSIPVQMTEEHFHGVLVGFGQLLDQFLHNLNFVFGFFDSCLKKTAVVYVHHIMV